MEALPFDPEAYLAEEREKKPIRIKSFGPYWHVSVGGHKVAQFHTKAAAASHAALLQVKTNGIFVPVE